jgi:hypothetical protein
VSFETYWLLVPSVGTVAAVSGCLVLWLLNRSSRQAQGSPEQQLQAYREKAAQFRERAERVDALADYLEARAEERAEARKNRHASDARPAPG